LHHPRNADRSRPTKSAPDHRGRRHSERAPVTAGQCLLHYVTWVRRRPRPSARQRASSTRDRTGRSCIPATSAAGPGNAHWRRRVGHLWTSGAASTAWGRTPPHGTTPGRGRIDQTGRPHLPAGPATGRRRQARPVPAGVFSSRYASQCVRLTSPAPVHDTAALHCR
jgi:hypothetical protein